MIKRYFKEPRELLFGIKKYIKKTAIVMDIGCGIKPQTYFSPKCHIMVEPFKEYVDILHYRFQKMDNVLIIQEMANKVLPTFTNRSIDTIFLLDVIEHLEKKDGMALLKEMERVAKKQIIIFTPLGYMPQEYEKHETDAWGLSGTELQEHKSGWEPKDFDGIKGNWSFLICENFHGKDAKGNPLEKPFGAFFAINNISPFKIETPKKLSIFKRHNRIEKKRGFIYRIVKNTKSVLKYYIKGK